MYDARSVYCYPGTDVLINKLNIRDQNRLDASERKLSGIRLMELIKNPVADQKWNLVHLKTIHRHIFQDIYPFAGALRTEQISKGNFRFASPLYIGSEADRIFQALKKEQYLTGLRKNNMCERMAYYFSEINVLHPFREGNGRTEREFLRTLVLKNGYTLDFKKISRSELLKASERSVIDAHVLIPLFKKAILEDTPSPALIAEWNRHQGKAFL
ncbi:Fic family protein [Sporolactobacillus sp. CQH2019]|uniref:Fic/DOC family protein n=1 Tax=Sporolactobacillus sp. CQH2019 TaxID=3023512 RepID=UPI0023674F09|nr:Fic family protein [Sporolactobacillus sp. CQH2019]MDD9150484.1 Fic family protein [Sporolactobacillus sp. CQH2019]